MKARHIITYCKQILILLRAVLHCTAAYSSSPGAVITKCIEINKHGAVAKREKKKESAHATNPQFRSKSKVLSAVLLLISLNP